MRKQFLCSLLAILLLFSFVLAGGHEYTPIQEKEIKYQDWTYKTFGGSKDLNLRKFTKGKKLVLVIYFAPWCGTWKFQAPVVERYYEKYKDKGFDVVGISEYGSQEELKANLAENKITFPVVVESEKTEDKTTTKHYAYRKSVGDTRNWGSPWSIFLGPDNLTKKGDVLLEKAFVVNGEMIEDESEKFIRGKLGLPAEEQKLTTASADKTVEACKPETKPVLNLKKPQH